MSFFPEDLAAARFRASDHYPYFNSALYSITPVNMPGLYKKMGSPIGIDKWWRLYYDMPKIQELGWSVEILANILIHEISHPLRNHAERCVIMGADHQIWNIATDCAINWHLRQEKCVLPDNVCYPELYGMPENLLEEEYYERLMENATKVKVSIKNPGVAGGNCGSGATGIKEDWEISGDDNREGQTPSISSSEAELIRRKVAQDMIEHSQSRGTLPAGWERWAQEILHPQVNWRKELPAQVRRGLMAITGKQDYTYARLSRRQLPGIILPAMQGPIPKVDLLIDTSGSMGDKELGQALGELQGMLRATGVRDVGVRVYSCDAALHTAQKVFSVNQAKLAGGGGTDMCEGIRAIAERTRKDRANILVIVSDGYTPWPPTQPTEWEYVITVLVADGNEPGWGKVIRVQPKQE
jgi:predicted metal-dependent peptidase